MCLGQLQQIVIMARIIINGYGYERIVSRRLEALCLCLRQQQGITGVKLRTVGSAEPSMALSSVRAESGCSVIRESARSMTASVGACLPHDTDSAAIAIMKRMARYFIGYG